MTKSALGEKGEGKVSHLLASAVCSNATMLCPGVACPEPHRNSHYDFIDQHHPHKVKCFTSYLFMTLVSKRSTFGTDDMGPWEGLLTWVKGHTQMRTNKIHNGIEKSTGSNWFILHLWPEVTFTMAGDMLPARPWEAPLIVAKRLWLPNPIT